MFAFRNHSLGKPFRYLLFGVLVLICFFYKYKLLGNEISKSESNKKKYLHRNANGNFESTESILKNKTIDADTTADIANVVSNDIDERNIISAAIEVSRYNKTVMVTFVNEAYLPLADSWLCNTKDMGVHKSMLVIVSAHRTKENITKAWPDVTVIVDGTNIPQGDQEYSHVGYLKILIRRTEIILSLLLNDMEIMLFEFDYVWFSNPVPGFQTMNDADILVNPVSVTVGILNGGLVYLFATEQTKSLWRKLTEMMQDLGVRMQKDSDSNFVPENENDQQYFSRLINERYAGIRTRELSLDKFADGMWYSLSASERNKTHPILISNNWIIGNENKMARAKEWRHWFVKDDGTCDDELVSRTVYK